MNKGETRISRAELYDQVWSVSMVKLGEQYGLSDVGLAKICKRHKIPRPPRGYWARKAAGYKVKRLPLPPGENVTIEITPNPYSRHGPKLTDDLSRISPSKRLDEEPIVVPDRLSSPHPLIKQSSEILNGRQPNDPGLVKHSYILSNISAST